MGMFDHVLIHDSIPLPCKGRPKGLQTKNLGCELASYKITNYGRLVRISSNSDQNYDGVLTAIGSLKGHKGRNMIDLQFIFENGFVISVVEINPITRDAGEKLSIEIPLRKKLLRILHIVIHEVRMIFYPPDKDIWYVLPEKPETILF